MNLRRFFALEKVECTELERYGQVVQKAFFLCDVNCIFVDGIANVAGSRAMCGASCHFGGYWLRDSTTNVHIISLSMCLANLIASKQTQRIGVCVSRIMFAHTAAQ